MRKRRGGEKVVGETIKRCSHLSYYAEISGARGRAKPGRVTEAKRGGGGRVTGKEMEACGKKATRRSVNRYVCHN